MAARTVYNSSASRTNRGPTKLTSTPSTSKPSSTRKASQSEPQSLLASKRKILYEGSVWSSSSKTTRKRKRPSDPISTPPGKVNAPIVDLTGENDEADAELATALKKRKTMASPKGHNEEKRLKMFRKKAPLSMFVIGRTRGGTDEVPEETIEMAGTTGNIYSININQLPSCTCPDNQKGNQCKHIVYVLHNVLKAPAHLQYQLAFISSELREVFSFAPPLPSSQVSGASTTHPNNRKEVSGDCPICFTEFEPDKEEIVWCKAACGNNIHKECFEQWARSQKGKEVRCVYCRAPWQGDEDSLRNTKVKRKINDEGYVNVAAELGLSGARDYSTYHQPWVRRNFGYY
ncbi:hypothetical protein MMC08_001701 [Hypocenomyce scalaris]|nr:hypothetical protein [Hypocenomyce scalaris]